MKDGVKDGYKCIFKRQGRGKDVTVFQPSPICQKSFKCKTETQQKFYEYYILLLNTEITTIYC